MEFSKIGDPCLKYVLGMVPAALRTLEISFALFILFYVTSRIPTALQLLLNFSLGFLDFAASTAFAFGLCNAIIVAVFAKASRSAAGDETVRESYNWMIEDGDDLRDHWTLSLLLSDAYNEEELCEKVVCEDDKITGQLMKAITFCEEEESESNEVSSVPDFGEDYYDDEDEEMLGFEKAPRSDDELKKRVEDFIAKELRFRREESLAIVLQSY